MKNGMKGTAIVLLALLGGIIGVMIYSAAVVLKEISNG